MTRVLILGANYFSTDKYMDYVALGYNIMVPDKLRDGLMQHLTENGIMSKVNFYPVHKTHFYKNELKYNTILPVTEKVSTRVITLPLHPKISRKDINDITGCIADYLSKAK